MKVQGDNGLAALQGARAEAASSQSTATREKAGASGIPTQASSLELSSEVGKVEEIRELAKAEPEVRADVVAQAKADLAAGTLTADPSELAALIARDLF
jgi:flagellar biosynthesis anti-sigma factor FlgM